MSDPFQFQFKCKLEKGKEFKKGGGDINTIITNATTIVSKLKLISQFYTLIAGHVQHAALLS